MGSNARLCEVAKTINNLEYSLFIIGSLGFIASLSVIAVILAYRKDVYSLRERVLLGLFFWNLVYSIANMSPRYLVHSNEHQPNECAHPLYDLDMTVPLFALWMGSKYGIIVYEFFALSTSILGLRSCTDDAIIGKVGERLSHVACSVIAVAIFGLFCALDMGNVHVLRECTTTCDQHRQVDVNATELCIMQCFIDLGHAYDALMSTFMLVWVVLLGLTIFLWGYFRVIVCKLDNERTTTLQSEQERLADQYCFDDQLPMRERKLRLLHLHTDRYLEFAKPLERYVVVFLVFGVPAVVMAAVEERGVVILACECILGFRAIASVVVYFWDRERRNEIRDWRMLCKRLHNRVQVWIGRMCPCVSVTRKDSVHFADSVSVRHIGPQGEDNDINTDRESCMGLLSASYMNTNDDNDNNNTTTNNNNNNNNSSSNTNNNNNNNNTNNTTTDDNHERAYVEYTTTDDTTLLLGSNDKSSISTIPYIALDD